MFLYEKKIIYLSRYQNEIRESKAGFIKFLREKNACILDIHIRLDLSVPDGDYMLFLVMPGMEIAWKTIYIEGGSAFLQKQLEIRHEMMYIGQEEYEESALQGITLRLDGKNWIAGYFKEPESMSVPTGYPANGEVPERKGQSETEDGLWAADGIIRQKPNLCQSDKKVKVQETVSDDKWEQLQRNYQKVHPFGDDRMFLMIEPKDFVVLQAPFQKLVNNSFLLHGFYNYRHLILGPDMALGGGGSQFYIGVPGTYFEREKMVAVMFGFEGFECEGAVEVGKFGYYMRRVEL